MCEYVILLYDRYQMYSLVIYHIDVISMVSCAERSGKRTVTTIKGTMQIVQYRTIHIWRPSGSFRSFLARSPTFTSSLFSPLWLRLCLSLTQVLGLALPSRRSQVHIQIFEDLISCKTTTTNNYWSSSCSFQSTYINNCNKIDNTIK